LNDDKWILASLPLRFGGIGVRRVCDLGIPSFLSSVNGVYELICDIIPSISKADNSDISFYADAIEAWKNLGIDSMPPVQSSQQNWNIINVENIVDSLSFPTELDKARYNASCSLEASAWLSALPSKNVGLLLNNNDFRMSIAVRLGTNVCLPHVCICGLNVDECGVHGLSCPKECWSFFKTFHTERHSETCFCFRWSTNRSRA